MAPPDASHGFQPVATAACCGPALVTVACDERQLPAVRYGPAAPRRMPLPTPSTLWASAPQTGPLGRPRDGCRFLRPARSGRARLKRGRWGGPATDAAF